MHMYDHENTPGRAMARPDGAGELIKKQSMEQKSGDVGVILCFFFSSRRRHTRYWRDWSSDVCSSDLGLRVSIARARRPHSLLDMDPVRNPYAPGAGQRPPELAGRDTELSAFDVVLERLAHGRPERSLVLTGLRGVGKTVLLNQLRPAAISRGWRPGKIEARPEQSLRRPVSSALHMALRELGPRHRDQESMDEVLGVLKAFAQRQADGPSGAPAKVRDRWQPGIDVPAATGRADSGDMEIDLVELLSDAAGVAADIGSGIALFIDEMQDVQPDDVSAICAACHELSQQGAPLIVVGAGLPPLPAVLSASKSYSERLFRYLRIDRLEREAADRALIAPAEREDVRFEQGALEDRKSTRLNSSHANISYAVFCLKKK